MFSPLSGGCSVIISLHHCLCLQFLSQLFPLLHRCLGLSCWMCPHIPEQNGHAHSFLSILLSACSIDHVFIADILMQCAGFGLWSSSSGDRFSFSQWEWSHWLPHPSKQDSLMLAFLSGSLTKSPPLNKCLSLLLLGGRVFECPLLSGPDNSWVAKNSCHLKTMPSSSTLRSGERCLS